MMNELARLKPALAQRMAAFLARAGAESDFVSEWAKDLFPRLLDYSTRGKMIRGALVGLGASVFSGRPFGGDSEQDRHCLDIGVAMELIQSLLLIHDDIMDQDDMRRGKPSVHAQYVHLARGRQALDPARLGESMGICAGDVSGFLAFELLSGLAAPPETIRRLLVLTSRELTYVGLAQMGDVHNGAVAAEVGLADIVRLYRYKTGRYTFSLPLMAGAIVAGAGQAELDALAELGELYGVIFQIKDDDLGLFGNSERTGKPVGSDIREGKKTLHRHYLLERCDVAERQSLRAVFGSRSAGDAELRLVLRRMEQTGVREQIDAELDAYAAQARRLIDGLSGADAEGRAKLHQLLAYNLEREA